MDTFFHPASVAVVGASMRKGGHNLITNLLFGYKGAIYPVNPNYNEIESLPCFPSIEGIPQPVDLAIIFVPAPAVPAVLEACARKGVKRVMIESAGFAEVGETGMAIQNRCLHIAREAGIRIWGPNCMGIVDVPGKHFFTFMLPQIYEDGLIPGRISLIVQSGMLSAAFIADLMSGRGIGVGKVCSIGNKADVDECDLLLYLLNDPKTDAVALYLESIPRGRLFVEIAGRARKPVVVLKGGKSEAGSRAAMSHTSSLAGNARLLEGVLRSAGIAQASDFHQMVDLARSLSTGRGPAPECRTAILTFSGGAGILSCDLLEKQGLRVARLSEGSREALSRLYPDWMPVANPVDLYPAIERHGRVRTYEQAISIVLEDPNVDVLLIHYVSGLEGESLDLASIKRRADARGKKVLFWILGRRAPSRAFRLEAQANGLEFHGEISRAVECLAATVDYGKRRLLGSPEKETGLVSTVPDLEAFGAGERLWDEHESKRFLKRWNIPVVEERIVEGLLDLERAAEELGYPLVLKGLLPGEVHKTESGLIRLGLTGPAEVQKAYEAVSDKMRGQGRILLQRQVRIDYELIAGYLLDEQFGPCVMFGLGGILAELEPDVAFALAPLTREGALGLMNGIRARRLLKGFRGMAPIREDLMADLLVALGNLGSAYSEIEQIDINPVAVSKGVPVAVDATVILKPLEPSRREK
jgi:acyl-CoA synthetase (NDP forming)